MGNKLTRGNLLATLKELKKMPRPKVGVANASVQAICSSSNAIKPSKNTDVKATVERRRVLFNNGKLGSIPFEETDYFKKFEAEFNVFMADNYKLRELRRKKSLESTQVG